jgi:glycosyltransferase involved in cell wall biosynthesis
VLVPSHVQALAVQKFSPGTDPQVIPNGVDTDFFTPAASPSLDEGFRFASIGSFEPVKGFEFLLEAFSLAFKDKQVSLVLAGGGKEREALGWLARELGIESQVAFHGALSHSQVRGLLHESHCLVSASLHETFGITLIEAGACGLPVIATRCGGPQEIVNQLNGILVLPGDAPALAAGMQEMVSGYRRYDPALIRADCESRFSLRTVVSRLEAIYQDLLCEAREGSC